MFLEYTFMNALKFSIAKNAKSIVSDRDQNEDYNFFSDIFHPYVSYKIEFGISVAAIRNEYLSL